LGYSFASLATLTLLLPMVAGARRLPFLSPARRLVLLFLALEFVNEDICFILGRLGRNNQWVPYTAVPIETALILAAFSRWQLDRGMERTLRAAAPLMLVFWLPPLLGWERPTEFSLGIESVQAILCVAIAAYTVVRRAMDLLGQPQEQDWFLIGTGVMLYFATFALMDPLNRYLMRHSPPTAIAVLTVRAGAQIVANILYYHGMRCPISQRNSGHSSLVPPLSSPSSWWRSGRR